MKQVTEQNTITSEQRTRGHPITTQKQIRAMFWAEFPELERRRGSQNNQPTNTRVVFVGFIDALRRDGQISEALASRATL